MNEQAGVSTPCTGAETPKKNPAKERRAGIAAALGTVLEYFDFAVFGLLSAVVFPVLFFRELDGATALLASFATFGVGFFARPLGAFTFAVIGDRHGRRRALNGTLWLMGLSSVLVGVLPGYDQIGVLAPLFLVILRFAQGLAAGGEITGAQLLALEHAPRERRGRAGSRVAVASPVAQVLANLALVGLAAALTDDEFISWGWRLPLVAAFLLLVVAGWIRSRVDETPEFEAAQSKGADRTGPFQVFRSYPKVTVLLLLSWAGPHCLFPLVTVFGISYMTMEAGFSRSAALSVMLCAHTVGIFGALAGGRVTDLIGSRNTMLIALCGLGVFFAPLFPLMDSGNVALIVICTAGTVSSILFGMSAQASFFADAFPVRLRYMGAAMAYAVSGVIFGGTAPFAATALLDLSSGGVIVITAYGLVIVIVSIASVLVRPVHSDLAPEVEETS